MDEENENGVKLSFETMLHALLDEPLEYWKEEVENLRLNQKSKAWLKIGTKGLIEEVCGEDACNNQLEHMKTARRPRDMPMSECLKMFFQ